MATILSLSDLERTFFEVAFPIGCIFQTSVDGNPSSLIRGGEHLSGRK